MAALNRFASLGLESWLLNRSFGLLTSSHSTCWASALVGEDEFLYGSSALWTVIYPNWHIHSGGKLPFFRQGYDWKKEPEPRLTVVARRLDRNEPLVWNGFASNAGMFVVTGIDIPSAGYWEIAAHYVQSFNSIQTLTYTVWVEP